MAAADDLNDLNARIAQEGAAATTAEARAKAAGQPAADKPTAKTAKS